MQSMLQLRVEVHQQSWTGNAWIGSALTLLPVVASHLKFAPKAPILTGIDSAQVLCWNVLRVTRHLSCQKRDPAQADSRRTFEISSSKSPHEES